MIKNCLFDKLPPGAQSVEGMVLAPSLWIGEKVKVGPDYQLVVSPGDLVQIVGVDFVGGIYVQLEDGYVLGAVDPDNLTPWRKYRNG